MAYALVGTIGATGQTAPSSGVTPPWGTGESRTAGNLLICFIGVTGTATLPVTPSGWTIAKQIAGTSCSATIYYKIAAGSDTAPTIAAVVGGVIAYQLAEFSGNATTSPLDQTGSATGTSSPITATQGAVDTAVGELLLTCGSDFRSTGRAPNDTWTSNNATITQAGSNNGTTSTTHYSFGYSLATTSKASADTAVMTLSVTTNITGLAVASATFKLASPQSLTRTTTDAPTTSTSNADPLGTFIRAATDAPTIAESAARVIVRAPILRTASESLKADQGGLNNTDPIAIWPDKSSAGNTATGLVGAGSSFPLFTTGGPNGLPCIIFGANGFNLATPIPGSSTSAFWTVVAVVYQSSGTGQFYLITDDDTNNRDAVRIYPSLGLMVNTNGGMYQGSAYPVDAWRVISATNNGPAAWVDGVAETLTFWNPSAAGKLAQIGSWVQGGQYGNGYIAVLAAFNTALSPTDRANAEATVAAKYALSVASGTPVDLTGIAGLAGYWEADVLSPLPPKRTCHVVQKRQRIADDLDDGRAACHCVAFLLGGAFNR